MFLGEYKHTIDDKGRVTIPSRYRPLLSEGAYITQGFDRNLMVLRPASFDSFARKLNQMNITDARGRQLRRLLLSRAEKVDLDSSGRILIPAFLRETVGINAEVVLIGSGYYFEMWSADSWQKQLIELDEAQIDADHFSALELFPDEEVA